MHSHQSLFNSQMMIKSVSGWKEHKLSSMLLRPYSVGPIFHRRKAAISAGPARSACPDSDWQRSSPSCGPHWSPILHASPLRPYHSVKHEASDSDGLLSCCTTGGKRPTYLKATVRRRRPAAATTVNADRMPRPSVSIFQIPVLGRGFVPATLYGNRTCFFRPMQITIRIHGVHHLPKVRPQHFRICR
jgi:hypothetical protein